MTQPASPAFPEPAETPKPGAVLVGLLVLLVVMGVIVLQSGVPMPRLLPEAISSYAEDVDTLFYVILGVTGFFFVLTEALLVYFCVRYRANGGRPVHTHGNHALELAWTFIPGLILFVLAVMQTGVWGDLKFKTGMPGPDENPLVVQVLGKQFEWHFRYAGEDGEFGTADDVTKLNEMRVPVDRAVVVELRTLDVLHSFWLPNARLKQDLLPGQTIRQWFKALKTGEYPIVCAELCGIGHTTMGGKLVVESEEEFLAWQAATLEMFGEHDPEDDPNWKYWKEQR